jgi:quercetin dioxygenase-like cupin family protein
LRGYVKEKDMKVVKMSQVSKEPFPNPIFTGSDVTRQTLVPDSKDFNAAIVNFGKGVRNKLHTHDSEQILIVTAGKGIVATEKEQKTVTAGDIILFSPGEKHWHGATGDSEFSHIYLTKLNSKTHIVE